MSFAMKSICKAIEEKQRFIATNYDVDTNYSEDDNRHSEYEEHHETIYHE